MLVGFHYAEKKVSIPKLHQTLFANPAMVILGVKFMQGLYDLTGVFLLITEISSCIHRNHTTLLKKYEGEFGIF